MKTLNYNNDNLCENIVLPNKFLRRHVYTLHKYNLQEYYRLMALGM